MAFCADLIYKQGKLPYDSYQLFRDMRQKKEFCDVTLNLGNGSVHAHKVILAASIPYFRSLFGSTTAEDQRKEISLTDINPGAVELLIDFAYTCELKINNSNVQMLLSAACFLEVDHVKEVCIEFIIKGLSPSDAVSVRDLGVRLSCVDLVEKVDKYVKENFDEVSHSEEFMYIPYWYLQDLVSSDDLHVSSEEKVFEAVIGWVKTQAEERIAGLPGLLSCIRMPFLKLYYLKDVIGADELVKQSLQCRDILDDARDYHLFPEKRHDSETTWKFACAPRKYEIENETLCFLVNGKHSSSKLKEGSADQKTLISEFSNLGFADTVKSTQPKMQNGFTQPSFMDAAKAKTRKHSNFSKIRNRQRRFQKPTFGTVEVPFSEQIAAVTSCTIQAYSSKVKHEDFCPNIKLGRFNFTETLTSYNMFTCATGKAKLFGAEEGFWSPQRVSNNVEVRKIISPTLTHRRTTNALEKPKLFPSTSVCT